MDIYKATPKKLTKIFRHIKGNNFNEEKAKFLNRTFSNLPSMLVVLKNQEL